MALNYLLHRHQVSLMCAAAARSVEGRRAHRAFAAAYADRIEAFVALAGGATAPLVRA